jgi:hypothetical protein
MFFDRFPRHALCHIKVRVLSVYGVLMLSKSEFNRAIEESTPPPINQARVVTPNPPRRMSKFLVTALVVVLGIGAGWLGGRILNGRMNESTASAPAGDSSSVENPTQSAQPEPGSSPVKRAETAETPDKKDTSSAPPAKAAKVEDPDDESEAQPPPKEAEPKKAPKEAEAKKAPPKVPRVDKEEEGAKPGEEDPSKEVGRKALKKINKANTNVSEKSAGDNKEKTGNKNNNANRP